MHVRAKGGRPREAGYILVGALALAVIVAVAVSMAIRSAQQRLDQDRAKEATAEARLAMDSAASRFITFLDQRLAFDGGLRPQDINSWCVQFGGTVVSGPYSVSLAAIPQPADTLEISDMCLNQGSPHKNPAEPTWAFTDMHMNVKNIKVLVTATSRVETHPSFSAEYTFQVRAIPVTEWAYFNPGQVRGSVSVLSAGNLDQSKVHAYVGSQTPAGRVSLPSQADDLKVALNSDPNLRLARTVGDTKSIAKFHNASSAAFASLYGAFSSSSPSVSWEDFKEYGLMRDTQEGINSAVWGKFQTFLNPSAGLYLPTKGPELGQTAAYTAITVGVNNPLYAPDDGGLVAVMDLRQYLAALTPVGSTVVVPLPYVNGRAMPLHTLLVTNSAFIDQSELNLTFPPTVQVFFADDVNTNRARLRVEGNIGFVPMMTNSVLDITNFVDNSRIPAPAYTNVLQVDVTRSDIPVDLTNGVFRITPAYNRIYDQLVNWAEGQQINLLSTPKLADGSDSPWYNPDAAIDNYFLPVRVFQLNESVSPHQDGINPSPWIYSDWATNTTSGVYTNTYKMFSYAGFVNVASYENCSGSLTRELTALNPELTDEYLTNTTFLMPNSDGLSAFSVEPDTSRIVTPFHDPAILDLQTYTPIPQAGNIQQATLGEWVPNNVSPLWSATTPENLEIQPYAVAFISMTNCEATGDSRYDPHAGWYWEGYESKVFEEEDLGHATAISTNGPILTAVDPTELIPGGNGTFWEDDLYNTWRDANVAAGNQVTSDQTKDTDRWSGENSWNSANVGAWKSVTEIAFRQDRTNQLILPTYTEENLRGSADGETLYQTHFNYRKIFFNYVTMGWGKTNIQVNPGPAPQFYGRLVVENGIKRLKNYEPTSMTIHGQVTYTWRTPAIQLAENYLNGFTVVHDQTTFPVNTAERFYDVRIARVDIRRNP